MQVEKPVGFGLRRNDLGLKIVSKSFPTLKKSMGGWSSFEVEMINSMLRDLLMVLADRFGEPFKDLVVDPQTGEFSPQIAILINGRHYTHLPDRLDTVLKEGDEVALFPPMAGG